jgi:hypothetical protein
MKKARSLFLIILMFCSLSTQVFAKNEGLVNEAERSVITAVGKVVSIVNGAEFNVSDRKVFENYFKTRNLSDEEADEAVDCIENAVKYFEDTGEISYSSLSDKEKVYFCNYLKKAADTLGLTLTFTYDKKAEIRNKTTSELVYRQEKVIKATGNGNLYILPIIASICCIFAATITLRKVSKNHD